MAAPQNGGWRSALLWTPRGTLEHVGANADTILTHHPNWRGVLGYDLFAEATVFREEPPGEWFPKMVHKGRAWTDADTTQLQTWLSRTEKLHLKAAGLDPVIDVVARRHAFHPVKRDIEKEEWDGEARLDTWLIRHGGAEDTALTRAVSARFLISAVARIYTPGCQVDHVLVLEGPQGIGKSSLVGVMASERFFLQTLPDDLGTEARKALQRKWIAELGELDHWTRAKVTKVRGFISERNDTYRDSYGRRTCDHPRHIVFIGTVNPPYMYLVDDAGGRRYWPVRLRYVKLAGVKQERAQLWAEALFRFKAGEPFHLTERELRISARAVQEDRHQKHPWEEAIGEFARIHKNRARQGMSLAEFHEVIGLTPDKQTRSTGQQIIACITRLGFQKVRLHIGGTRPRTWVLPFDKKLTKDRLSSTAE